MDNNDQTNAPIQHEHKTNTANATMVPALSIQLSRVHLIEASAGTGKTWTLAALVIRLLLESKRSPDQIIATTFTRAASAELRERICLRIHQSKTLIEQALAYFSENVVDSQKAIDPHFGATGYSHVLAALKADAKTANLLTDPLNAHVFEYLYNEEIRLAQGDMSTKKVGFLWAKNHLEMALIRLDAFFIGTLDSLCQKLLREFAFDLLLKQTQLQMLEVSDDSKQTVANLTHDAIRLWRTEAHRDNPKLMALLSESGLLTDIEDFKPAVDKVLNFSAIPLQPANSVALNLDQLDELIDELECADDELPELFSPQSDFYSQLHKGRSFYTHGGQWRSLKAKLIKHKLSVDNFLSDEEKALFSGFGDKLGGNFSTSNKDAQSYFEMLHIVYIVQRIWDTLQGLQIKLGQLREHQNYFVSAYVRKHLPSVLAAQGKTTFSLQLRALNQALENSPDIAQQIRHRYPAALIDEFQDVNADQAGMIYKIYQKGLDDTALAQGCLVLVGDPKQAIYGFRGGDILNYQRIKKTILKQNRHTLDTNRRSKKNLVNTLNHFFKHPEGLLEGIDFEPVKAHGTSDVLIDSCNQPVEALLRHMHPPDAPANASQIETFKPTLATLLADEIAHLLSTHKLLDKHTGCTRALSSDDIAVLFKSRWDVSDLERQLSRRGIPSFMGRSVSVFSGQMAQELAALMQAMLKPYHLGALRRVLVGMLFGLTQKQLDSLFDETQKSSTHTDQKNEHLLRLGDIQEHFWNAAKTWQRHGFLAAWQALASQYQFWQRLAKLPEGERHLVDLRQLLEVLQMQAPQRTNQQKTSQLGETRARSTEAQTQEGYLHTWFLRQLTTRPAEEWALERSLPSATGVQIMSIHKSKGLEFPVVFAVGLDSTSKAAKKLQDIFLVVDGDQVSLSAKSGMGDAHISAENKRRHAEDLRVAYVAFTRPSQLLYVATKEPFEKALLQTKQGQSTPKKNALSHWLTQKGKLNDEKIQLFSKPDTIHAQPAQANQLTDKNSTNPDGASWASNMSPLHKLNKTAFYPWYKTSFTKLSGQLEPTTAEPESADSYIWTQDEPQVEPYFLLPKTAQPDEEMALMRFSFPRGANAGSFLHKVFEKLDFTQTSRWDWLISTQAERFGIPMLEGDKDESENYTAEIAAWLNAVLNTPLSHGMPLKHIPAKKRLAEMSFNLSLGLEGVSANALSLLMQKHGFQLTLPPQQSIHRYLVGEIDLVYEAHGKYYVLDYKSNHLGANFTWYTQEKLKHAMAHAGYWLQAAIYLLALHRYLSIRLPQYDPAKHLGGVEYAFIRGMHPQSLELQNLKSKSLEQGKPTGVISWHPKADFVLELDAIFGNTSSLAV